jgi:hypothetical protein
MQAGKPAIERFPVAGPEGRSHGPSQAFAERNITAAVRCEERGANPQISVMRLAGSAGSRCHGQPLITSPTDTIPALHPAPIDGGCHRQSHRVLKAPTAAHPEAVGGLGRGAITALLSADANALASPIRAAIHRTHAAPPGAIQANVNRGPELRERIKPPVMLCGGAQAGEPAGIPGRSPAYFKPNPGRRRHSQGQVRLKGRGSWDTPCKQGVLAVSRVPV